MEQEFMLNDLKFLQENRAFLGREFLTWIWFKSESQDHKVHVKNFGPFQILIDSKMTLSSTSGSVRENSLKGNAPSYAREAGAALAAGKMLSEAKFILQNQDLHWSFVLSADDFSLRSVQLPGIVQDSSKSHFSQRIRYSQMLNEILDSLYDEYISIRIAADRFAEECAEMQRWLQTKADASQFA